MKFKPKIKEELHYGTNAFLAMISPPPLLSSSPPPSMLHDPVLSLVPLVLALLLGLALKLECLLHIACVAPHILAVRASWRPARGPSVRCPLALRHQEKEAAGAPSQMLSGRCLDWKTLWVGKH